MTRTNFRRVHVPGWAVAAAILVSTSTPFAQADDAASVVQRFVGSWQEDPSQRKIGAMGPLRFQRDSNGALQEIRGSDARPSYQNVVFDGKQRAIGGTNTIAWKQNSPKSFERVLTVDGAVFATRRIELSPDGKTLTENVERRSPDGQPVHDTAVYERTTGDAEGLVGRWKAKSFKSSRAGIARYEAHGTDGLKFFGVAGATWTGALDGKPTPVVGATTLPGTMRAAKAIDAYTIEFTQSREGVVTGKTVSAVSRDGKTMTVTFTPEGPNASTEPSVDVFRRK